MKIVVGVKRAMDYAVKVRIKPDKTAVELNNVKMSMNPFCEIAVEEAIRLKEKKVAKEVVVVSIGPKQAQETIRTALAMGADRGIHITTDMRTDQELQPLAVSKLFQWVAGKEEPNMMLFGKQSIDDDSNQVAQMTAALLEWPQATFASEVVVSDDASSVTVTREIDGGLQTISMPLPAVISADLRLAEPRYASLPGIMKAKKKKIDTFTIEDTGVDVSPRLEVLQVDEPPVRQGGVTVESVDELIEKLKNEKGLL